MSGVQHQAEHHEDVLAVITTKTTETSESQNDRRRLRKAERALAREAALMTTSMEREFRQLLDEFDAEGTGTFDVSELITISCALGEPLSEDESSLIIQDLDPSETGVVSFESLLTWWRRPIIS